MKILVFSHYYPPEGNAPATRMHALCKHWIRNGAAVQVITCAPNVPDGVLYAGYRNRWCQQEQIDGVPIMRVWTYLAPNRGTLRRILNFVSYMVTAVIAAAFVHRPDVVIATSPQFFCGWAGVFASRLHRVPLILEIRDIWPESIVTVGALRSRGLVRLLEWLEQKMYAAARYIVTVGDGYRDQLVKKGVPEGKIGVIPNGVDAELFSPRVCDYAVRDRWLMGNRFVCAYVGTIGMASGLDIVLRACQVLAARARTDIVLLVVGDGAVREDLERNARRLGIGNVIFTGRQDKEMIPAILAAVDACLVHLKKRDLFTTVLPSKIFEAAAMAKPIILGVEGYSADLVRRADAGICIEPEQEAQLATALERMADNRAWTAEMGRRGHEYFATRFDRGVLARRYLDVIHTVASGIDGTTEPARVAVG